MKVDSHGSFLFMPAAINWCSGRDIW